MASINGVTIKSLHTFLDHEGCRIAQGNVYIDGKKSGFWSQDYMSGPDRFDFATKELDDRTKDFRDGFPKDFKYRDFIERESMLSNLLTLMDREKWYKKYCKQGYKALTIVSDGFHEYMWATAETDPKKILKNLEAPIEEAKGELFKNRKACVDIYTSLDDFVLTVDSKHPAPEVFHN